MACCCTHATNLTRPHHHTCNPHATTTHATNPHYQVGFVPTGWSMGRTSKGLNKRGRRSQNGTVVLYQVGGRMNSTASFD